MELKSLIDERLVSFGLEVADKEDAMKKVAHMMLQADKISDEDAYLQGLFKREEEFETGIGNGIAIPHCKGKCVKTAAFSLVRLNNEIEWGSVDGKPVKYIIMLAAPDGKENIHLTMISTLARKFMDKEFMDSLLAADSMDDINKAFS